MAYQIKMPSVAGRMSWDDAARALRDPEPAAAVVFFRAALGEDWRGWTAGAPLADAFVTAFQIGPPECVRLHRMIGALDGTANLDLVVKDLGSRSWTKYVAAAMALEFCSRLHVADHAVQLIKPDEQKRPDARVILADRWVMIEFKSLHDGDDHAPWEGFVDQVLFGLWEHSLELDSFDIEFAEEALETPAAAIVESLRRIHASRTYEFETLPMGAGRARCADRKARYSIPVAQDDDVTRIEKKLRARTWSRQLAIITGATLLVVKSKSIFGGFGRRYVVERAAEACVGLIPVLRHLPEIGAVLVYEEPMLGVPPPFSAETTELSISMGASEGGHARVAMLIANPAARVPLATSEREVLVGDKMLW